MRKRGTDMRERKESECVLVYVCMCLFVCVCVCVFVSVLVCV